MKRIMLVLLVALFFVFLSHTIKTRKNVISQDVSSAVKNTSFVEKVYKPEFVPSNPSFALIVENIKKSDTIFYQYSERAFHASGVFDRLRWRISIHDDGAIVTKGDEEDFNNVITILEYSDNLYVWGKYR